MSGCEQLQRSLRILDQLIGPNKQRQRDRKAERLTISKLMTSSNPAGCLGLHLTLLARLVLDRHLFGCATCPEKVALQCGDDHE
jgi:hypothetical protein